MVRVEHRHQYELVGGRFHPKHDYDVVIKKRKMHKVHLLRYVDVVACVLALGHLLEIQTVWQVCLR